MVPCSFGPLDDCLRCWEISYRNMNPHPIVNLYYVIAQSWDVGVIGRMMMKMMMVVLVVVDMSRSNNDYR